MSEPWRGLRLLQVGILGGLLACAEATLPPPPPPPPPAQFTLALRQGEDHGVVPTQLLKLDLIITREPQFTSLITFSAETPPGVVVIFRPTSVLTRNDTDILIVAAEETARGAHQVKLIGRADGAPEQSVVFTLTVRDGAS